MKLIIVPLLIGFLIRLHAQDSAVVCNPNCHKVALTPAQQQGKHIQDSIGIAAIRADSIASANTHTMLTKLMALAQSAVGVRADSLSPQQQLALVDLLLFQAGAIDNSGKIKPLNRWVNNPANEVALPFKH